MRLLKHREPYMYVEHRNLTIEYGQVWDGETAIPVGSVAALLVGPGCTVTSAVFDAAASSNTQVLFVGERAVRFYCAGRPFGTESSYGERHALRWVKDPETARRILFAKRWFAHPKGSTAAEVMGEEGALCREMYKRLAARYKVRWTGRARTDFTSSDPLNDGLSWAGMAAKAVAMSAVNTVGAMPQLGFLHSGSNIAFVLDVADLVRNMLDETVFELAGSGETLNSRAVRVACRDTIRQEGLLDRLVRDVIEVVDG